MYLLMASRDSKKKEAVSHNKQYQPQSNRVHDSAQYNGANMTDTNLPHETDLENLKQELSISLSESGVK